MEIRSTNHNDFPNSSKKKGLASKAPPLPPLLMSSDPHTMTSAATGVVFASFPPSASAGGGAGPKAQTPSRGATTRNGEVLRQSSMARVTLNSQCKIPSCGTLTTRTVATEETAPVRSKSLTLNPTMLKPTLRSYTLNPKPYPLNP